MAKSRLSLTTLTVLSALLAGHRFGLAIMRETGLPSGTVYPVLNRAEDAGFVRGAWEHGDPSEGVGRPRRRYYELTDAGRHALERELTRLTLMASNMSALPKRVT
jgi:PadR family transcriptional regulator PadR